MSDQPTVEPKLATLTGVFTSFNLSTSLPKLRTDDGYLVLVGVPRGALEDFARACWRNKVRVEISGPVSEKDGAITAINVESMRVVVPE